MLNEKLRTENEVILSQKYDLVMMKKTENQIEIKKIKSNQASWIYFLLFFLAGGVIVFFSHQWLVYLLVSLILISTAGVLFLGYQTTIDFNAKIVNVEKKIFFLTFSKQIQFKEILDFKLKEGELGYYLKIQLGENLGFFNRLKSQWTLCRIALYQDSVDLHNWIREIIKPQ